MSVFPFALCFLASWRMVDFQKVSDPYLLETKLVFFHFFQPKIEHQLLQHFSSLVGWLDGNDGTVCASDD